MAFGATGEFSSTTQPSTGGGGGSGTVTSVSVVTANGFAGTVATASTTPAITVKTTITGVLKGNGTAISAATAGTDYSAGTSALGTGILKSTTGTGVLSIAVAGTDYLTPTGSGTGLTGVMLTSVYDPAGIDQQVVGTTATQTLTNKTLTAPVIATITNTGTLTLPTSTDTLVGRATTDTLTNKRITKRVLALTGSQATPTIDTDNYDVVHMTGLTANITSMTTNLSGTPVDGDTLRISFTDNGTARTILWGSSFEAATELPLTTTANVRLDVAFFWNTETSKWRCTGVTPGPVIVYADAGSVTLAAVGATPTTIYSPSLTIGTWKVEINLSLKLASSLGEVVVVGIYGGTASYTTPGLSGTAFSWNGSSGTGNPIAGRVSAPTAAAADNEMMLMFTTSVTVTAAGTVIIAGASTSGASIVSPTDATDFVTGVTSRISSVLCTLVG